jgi:hypothetical protein
VSDLVEWVKKVKESEGVSVRKIGERVVEWGIEWVNEGAVGE